MNKESYSVYHDEIAKKRLHSPYPLRAYAHQRQYDVVLQFVKPGMRVLDAGCGEGLLSILAAQKGAIVTGCDISAPNIEAAQKFAAAEGAVVTFLEADAENIPFPDNSFDLVFSSHVLEHLPDFDKGVSEIARLTKQYAVIAVPTATNVAALVQCGGGMFWLKGPRMFLALVVGAIRYIININGEGVDEGYANNKDFHHIWRYPWVIKQRLQKKFYIRTVIASTLMMPFFDFFLPSIKWFDAHDRAPLLRWCGYGTTFFVEKIDSKKF